MPLTGWLKSRLTETPHPSGKHESWVVGESLLMELDYQIKELERLAWEREQEERRKMSGVDYSWLVTVQQKPYEMPQLERLELEELCMRLRPNECGQIISMFRDSLLREPSVQELPRILRAIVIQILEARPKEETMAEWVTRRSQSLAKLRPSKIAPISGDMEDIETSARSKSVSVLFDHQIKDVFPV